MANIVKRYKKTKYTKEVRYIATVRIPDNYSKQVKSQSISKTFSSRKDAKDWYNSVSDAIKLETWEDPRCCNNVVTHTVEKALKYYLQHYTPKKKGAKAETDRINRWLQHPIAELSISELKYTHILEYVRERTEAGRAGQTIRNDLTPLSRALTTYAFEHGIELNPHPVEKVRKDGKDILPPINKHRDRRLEGNEEERMKEQLARRKFGKQMVPLMTLAIETGMRLGEMLAMRKSRIQNGFCKLPDTKNGESRNVWLSPAARDAVASLMDSKRDKLFTLTQSDVENSWKLARDAAGIEDLRFHDLRHEAVSRMANQGVPIGVIKKQSGHKNLSSLSRYINATTAEMQQAFEKITPCQ